MSGHCDLLHDALMGSICFRVPFWFSFFLCPVLLPILSFTQLLVPNKLRAPKLHLNTCFQKTQLMAVVMYHLVFF